MNFLIALEAKRDGHALTADDIRSIIREYTEGSIPDYQMAALLMAIYLRSLNSEETRSLMLAMRDSGRTLAFPKDRRPLVDKHSTGGIGDKVSLSLAPLLACLGFRVPMISGRGLGITGGTLDKLESIPGFATTLPIERIVEQVQSVGCIICAATDDMVPADKKLYALRDATGTIGSIPLITASILSKKLAEGISSLVLDVKYGSAAFMRTVESAQELARGMVKLATNCGVKGSALITNMNTPLGRSAGNWLEVKETVEFLEGRAMAEDLRELVIECAARLLVMERMSPGLPKARQAAAECLASGKPRAKFDEMLAAQGADMTAFAAKLHSTAGAGCVLEVKASKAGYVSACDARIIGEVVRSLGGSRSHKDATINYDVGIDCIRKSGEPISRGEPLCRIHAASTADAEAAAAKVSEAFQITTNAPKPSPLIHSVVAG